MKRVEVLTRQLHNAKPDRITSRKLELLRAITVGPDIAAENE